MQCQVDLVDSLPTLAPHLEYLRGLVPIDGEDLVELPMADDTPLATPNSTTTRGRTVRHIVYSKAIASKTPLHDAKTLSRCLLKVASRMNSRTINKISKRPQPRI